MKKFFEDFLRYFFSTPLLPLLIVVCSVSATFITSDRHAGNEEALPVYVSTSSSVQLSAEVSSVTSSTAVTTLVTSTAAELSTSVTGSSQTSLSASDTSSASTAAAAETSTEAAPEPPPERPVIADYSVYLSSESPNSGYYQERLTVIGDSIAYGFNAYGYIPYEHNIAKESLALWNINSYSFDIGGGSMGVLDAAAYADPSIIYLSIGMNDIYSFYPDDYAWNMCSLAQQLIDAVPDTTVIIGAITPVSENNYYTTNDRIREFNYALENAVYSTSSPQILFFDAYTVLADPYTLALADDAAGGDGLHLAGISYGYMLNALFNFLDDYGVPERIQLHDSKYQ